jgi:hypothetical protein
MPEWNSSEAPASVVIGDDRPHTSGHMDDRLIRMLVETDSPHVDHSLESAGTPVPLIANMTPAEAYHLADDLVAAADHAWKGAEYVVVCRYQGPDGPRETILETVKGRDPEDAVRRAKKIAQGRVDRGDSVRSELIQALGADEPTYYTLRADSMESVETDPNAEN